MTTVDNFGRVSGCFGSWLLKFAVEGPRNLVETQSISRMTCIENRRDIIAAMKESVDIWMMSIGVFGFNSESQPLINSHFLKFGGERLRNSENIRSSLVSGWKQRVVLFWVLRIAHPLDEAIRQASFVFGLTLKHILGADIREIS